MIISEKSRKGIQANCEKCTHSKVCGLKDTKNREFDFLNATIADFECITIPYASCMYYDAIKEDEDVETI